MTVCLNTGNELSLPLAQRLSALFLFTVSGQDFGFSAGPVLVVKAFVTAALLIEFISPAADFFLNSWVCLRERRVIWIDGSRCLRWRPAVDGDRLFLRFFRACCFLATGRALIICHTSLYAPACISC